MMNMKDALNPQVYYQIYRIHFSYMKFDQSQWIFSVEKNHM